MRYAADMPSLDFTPLEDALNHLDDGLREAERQKTSELLRDDVMQRALETDFGDPVDQMPLQRRGLRPDAASLRTSAIGEVKRDGARKKTHALGFKIRSDAGP